MFSIPAQALDVESSTPKFTPGQYGFDRFGNEWVYLQTSVTLAFGDAVEVAPFNAALNADVDEAAAVDTRRVKGTGDFVTTNLIDIASADLPNGHTYFLWIDADGGAGTMIGQGGPIIQRVDDDYVDVYFVHSNDGLLSVALTTAADFIVYTLTRVRKATTISASQHVGYVQRQAGITDEYWFWGLVRGHGYALIDFDDTTVVAFDPIITGTADGRIQGATIATAAHSAFTGGYGLVDQTADGVIPFIADARMRVSHRRPPANLRRAYPGERL